MRTILMALLIGPLLSRAEAPAAPLPVADDMVATAEGELLHVESRGHGPALVLIPGLMGSAYGFRRVVGPLADAGHRVLVVEPLGIGGSSRPREADYSLTAQADRVSSVLRALDTGPAILVAHSVGASIALRIAYRHPEQVAAIVSLDGGPAEAAGTKGFRRAMRFAPLLRLFGGTGRIRGHVRSTLVERSADPKWVTDEVVDGYMAGPARDIGATLRAYGQMARAKEPEALAPHLPSIRCPLRLVIGTAVREGGISTDEIQQLEASVPAFALDPVAGAGHFVFEEQPQAVVAAVQAVSGGARAARREARR
jgi:pimeloyl-ACP methyl ester carboxylesterase